MQVNYKTEISGTVETAVTKITDALLKEGFGVLTRIDLHTKIKDKLNKMISPTVILGACNPTLAYEAFNSNPDVASLLPCNAVVREIVPGLISIELAKPSAYDWCRRLVRKGFLTEETKGSFRAVPGMKVNIVER